ncbi:MAG: DNA topoisomerase I [Acidilobaceae archaeon]
MRSKVSCRIPSSYIAVIAEKPKAGEKIARALGFPSKCSYNGIPFWVLNVDGSNIIVVASAGHMFGLHTRSRGFPVFTYTWRPLWEIEASSQHLRRFYELLSTILPKASMYVSACDYDIEGSLICYMIIERLGDINKAKRMKFSTLTPQEIRGSYKRLLPLDRDMVEAGLARHELDWLWGINISRALTGAVRSVAGDKRVLSAGRVQSPTLIEAVRRWEDLNLHTPKPIISIVITLSAGPGKQFKAYPKGWKAETRLEALNVKRELEASRTLKVTSKSHSVESITPPPPFNLGDLQHEAYRLYKLPPMKTQEIAENLYLEGLISYPRTNSQKLPPTLNYEGIIKGLSSIPEYSGLAMTLIAETGGVLKPVQGKMDDPAHPAIHPTGEKPGRLEGGYKAVYDLIVRRFLAAFAKPASIARAKLVVKDSWGRLYESHGVNVLREGWLKYYPFLKPEGEPLPDVVEGGVVRVLDVSINISWSTPGVRLSKDSLLKWMEEMEIGTEATRARIIEVLYKRGYIIDRDGRSTVSDLGYAVAYIISELFPELSSPELTRVFEKKLEDIRLGRARREEVKEEAVKTIEALLKEYNKRLDTVKDSIAKALQLKKPDKPCLICGRESIELNLCKYHYKAAFKLGETISEITKTLNTTPEEALETLASKKSLTGLWVIEVSREAVKNKALKELILKRSPPA